MKKLRLISYIIMILVLSGCSNDKYTTYLVHGEITRTSEYDLYTRTNFDNTGIDFIDLNNGKVVTGMYISPDSFYTLKKGDKIVLRRTDWKDKSTYYYNQSDNDIDINSIEKSLYNEEDISNINVNIEIVAKKETKDRSTKHLSRKIYIYDKEIDRIFMLKRINEVWSIVEPGDTVLAQRSKLNYNGKDYYHYYILLKGNN